MATEILKKQTIVGTDAQYEGNRHLYEEGTVFESTSLLGESDIDPTYTNKFVQKRTTTSGVKLYAYDSTGDISQIADTGRGAYTIARRDAGGVLNVGDPVGQYNAVHKAYVDNRFRYTHSIDIEFSPMEGVVICKGIITYVSNSPIPLISYEQLPLDVELPVQGIMVSGTSWAPLYKATRKEHSDGKIYLEMTYLQYDSNNYITVGGKNTELAGDITFVDTVL